MNAKSALEALLGRRADLLADQILTPLPHRTSARGL